MMNAARASVLDCPEYGSEALRIANPGRFATSHAQSRATAIDNGPMVFG